MLVFAAVLRILVHHNGIADDDTDETDDTQDRRDRDIELEYPQAQHGTEDAEHRAGERKERQAYLTKMVQKQYQHHCQRCNDRPEYLRQEYLIHFRQATIRDRYTLR